MKETQNLMMFTKGTDNKGYPQFSLIPLSLDSPYIQGTFHYEQKILSLLTKESIDDFRIVHKLDDHGNIAKSNVNNDGKKYEKVRIKSFYDIAITDEQDIKTFVNLMDGSVKSEDLDIYFVPVPKSEIPMGNVPAPDGVKLTVKKKDGDQTS